jgi:aryl-alcohol dehydrogenase-like predicted oxidoreductase
MANLGTTDLDVFALCLGGNVFGWTADRDASFAVLDAYTEAGGNFIDTADTYMRPNMGISERIIGEWMAARGNRDSLVIATKVGSDGGLSADNIAEHAEGSLRRLQTDRIDLYYAHKDDGDVPVEETVRAFDALVRAGKVRYVAASNLTGERLAESLEVAAREGLAPYAALQPHYNLVEREGYEREFAPIVAAHDLAVAPYYALAKGFLTGKYRDDSSDGDGSPRAEGARAYLDERGRAVLGALDDIAAAHETAVAAVAVAWLGAQPGVVAPIASARSVEQLAGVLPAVGLQLTGDELTRLNEVSA